nr:MAG TPA: hypothetical protein [Caudoviricetes sp.]
MHFVGRVGKQFHFELKSLYGPARGLKRRVNI